MTSKNIAKNVRRPSPPRHTCCVAGYYVPGSDEREVVRITASVVDTLTDKIVESREFWWDDDLELAVEESINLASKYNAQVFMVSEVSPLENCPCCCGDYLYRTVRRDDLAAMQRKGIGGR